MDKKCQGGWKNQGHDKKLFKIIVWWKKLTKLNIRHQLIHENYSDIISFNSKKKKNFLLPATAVSRLT